MWRLRQWCCFLGVTKTAAPLCEPAAVVAVTLLRERATAVAFGLLGERAAAAVLYLGACSSDGGDCAPSLASSDGNGLP